MKTNLLIGNRNDCGFDGNSSWLAGTILLIRHRGLDRLSKTSRQLASSVMLAGAFAAAQVQAQIVFDATADFSITNGNPNGAWFYGWMPTDFSVFNLHSNATANINGRSPGWDSVASVWKNLGGEVYEVPTGWLSLHPGPGEEPSVVRWTSPSFGLAHIQGRFLPGDIHGFMLVAVRQGGQTLWRASDSGAFELLANVVGGDTVDFVVYGGYAHGNTPLEATVALFQNGIYPWPTSCTVAESASAVLVEVLRAGPEHLNKAVTVDYTTVDDSARAGEDYGVTSGTLQFGPGETYKVIKIPILNDALKESEEQFRLVLSNPTGGVSLGSSNVVIHIQDNDPGVRFMTENVVASEVAGVVTVAVQRGDDLNLPFTVDYATVEGTAHAGVDYVGASGTLQFAAGEPNKQITITILKDGLKEPWEQLVLVLSNPTSGVSLGNSNLVIWIRSDELMTYFVNVNNPNSVFPYTSWATAATKIQDAVDAARAGDMVLVTNGVYRAGDVEARGRNRVALTNQVVLRSVNGPKATIIDGGGTVRCVYLGTNTLISGFTLKNGYAPDWQWSGDRGGGGAYGGTLTNCTLRANRGGSGGGARNSTLSNCTLTDNSADYGGGMDGSTLYNCTVAGNWAYYGGGSGNSTLYNCVLMGNSAYYGGSGAGGGAHGGTLYNCTLTGNSADDGGGAAGGALYNCTLTDNSASNGGGGVYGGTLYNCIVYSNQSPNGANYSFVDGSPLTIAYSCTTPLPTNGVGNIDADPQLTWGMHLLPTSPCLSAGSAAYATGVDIDGEPWANPPAMGADQPHAGPVKQRIDFTFTRIAPSYSQTFLARNTGPGWKIVWDFGDGTTVTNQLVTSHAWETTGVYTVRLTAYDATFPEGVTSTAQVEVVDVVYYVNQANPTPVFPYASWASAATTIQEAVEAGNMPGRLILVTNGVYRTGSVATWDEYFNPHYNRVVLTDAVALRSVNGPSVTLIEGAPGPTDYPEESIRCIYVGDGALVSGFTLTNGWAYGTGGGGVYGEPFAVLTNCVLRGNSALSYNYYGEVTPGVGGGVYGGMLYNCTLAGNIGGGALSSTLYNCMVTNNSGSGASGSTLYDCTLTGNSAYEGGGASFSTLYNCTLADNSASSGGGVYASTLYNCSVMGNTAGQGGGVCASFSWWINPVPTVLYNCTLVGNTAQEGGGVYGGTLYNCIVMGNTAGQGGGVYAGYGSWYEPIPAVLYNCTLVSNTAQEGGGAYGAPVELHNCIVAGNTARQGGGTAGGKLYNCVLTENSADEAGGVTGAHGPTYETYYPSQLRNCIVYFNHALMSGGVNYGSASFEYSCTTPLPEGPGNIDAAPQLAWDNHLLPTSPCVAAGNADYATGRDMDGEPWANPPCMGADQFVPGPGTGALTMQIHSDSSQVAPGYVVLFVAGNIGRLVGLVWDFGDGTVVTNRAFVSHAWDRPGIYTIRLTGYNDSFRAGVTSTVQIEVVDAVHYVNAVNLNPVFPYASWATAATNIQDAVTASTVPGRLVLVTNGVYRTGVATANGTNRVALTNRLVLRSVNGPDVTTIEGALGDQPVRCAYVGNRAVLSGFTLTRGKAVVGGGAYSEPSGVVTNCTLTGNSADYYGGGACGSTLYNSTLTGNSGGGASGSTLYNCLVTDNGGGSDGLFFNCTVVGNNGGVSGKLFNSIVYYNSGGNYAEGTTLNYSCTTPLPEGPGNIDSAPQLVWDLHLLPTSPCVAAGNAAYAIGRDIDGEPWANPPCMGADQVVAGPVTGALTMQIHSDFSQVAPGYVVLFMAQNTGRLVRLVWDFGDGTFITNQPHISHAWATPGNYTVRLTGYNDSFPAGVAITVQVEVIDAVHYVNVANLNPVFPYASWVTAATKIQDAVTASTVPGRLVLVTNGVYRTGVTTANGTSRVALTNTLVLRSVNGPAATIIHGGGTVRCVFLGPNTVISGFTMTSGSVGGVMCANATAVVTNCIITGNAGGGASGGTLYNCTVSGNSGSGASEATLYDCTLTDNLASGGGGAVSSTLYNCTLTSNSASYAGGGAFGGALYNCVLTGNSAIGNGGYGGGVFGSTLYNCTLTGNSSSGGGGGAGVSALYNCTVAGNSGGGAQDSTLYNCTVTSNSGGGVISYWYAITIFNSIVYGNTNANYDQNTILNYCLTTPLPTNGVSNIAADPRFVNAAAGDFRLRPDSPCINAGLNAYVSSATDFGGLPRIVSGTVDIGAYEFQGSGSTISYAWLQQYGLPTDGSADATDPDRDGLNTWQEWRCQTDPTNALSVLRLLTAAPAGTNLTVSWQSVAGVNYFLERSTDLSASPPFTLLAPNLPGQPGTTSYADTNAVGTGPFFYRVGVGN